MRNTQENFPNVPVENLSDWQVKNKETEELFDVTNAVLDGQYTEVSFGDEEIAETTVFTPVVGEQLENDKYSVVFKYGGEPVIDFDGTTN
jgi:hypothetical protein